MLLLKENSHQWSLLIRFQLLENEFCFFTMKNNEPHVFVSNVFILLAAIIVLLLSYIY